MLKRTAEEWDEIFTAHGLQNSQILDYQAFIGHPHAAAMDLFDQIKVPGLETPLSMPRLPGTEPGARQGALAHSPTIGEHSREIRAALDGDGDDKS